jgi:protein phosphatase
MSDADLGRSLVSSRRRFSVEWGALTHKGLVRVTNEDCFFVGRFDRMLQPMLTNLPESTSRSWHYDAGYAVVIADGMGGEVAGEIASHTAVSTLIDLAVETPDWIMRYDDPSLVAEVTRRMDERVRRVDELIQAIGKSQPKLAGMGTTLTALALLPPRALVAHVGDSRAYVVRDGRLRQITRDHTIVQELLDAGLIDPREAARHPARNVLTSAAGHGGGSLAVDVHPVDVRGGDQFLLCTDGLSGLVGDADIQGVLLAEESAATACKTLIDLALARGGSDNVTAVLGRVSEERSS